MGEAGRGWVRSGAGEDREGRGAVQGACVVCKKWAGLLAAQGPAALLPVLPYETCCLSGWRWPTLRLAMMQRPIREAPIQAMTCGTA